MSFLPLCFNATMERRFQPGRISVMYLGITDFQLRTYFDRNKVIIITDPQFGSSLGLCEGLIVNVDREMKCPVFDVSAFNDSLPLIAAADFHQVFADGHRHRERISGFELLPVKCSQKESGAQHVERATRTNDKGGIDFRFSRRIAARAYRGVLVRIRESKFVNQMVMIFVRMLRAEQQGIVGGIIAIHRVTHPVNGFKKFDSTEMQPIARRALPLTSGLAERE